MTGSSAGAPTQQGQRGRLWLLERWGIARSLWLYRLGNSRARDMAELYRDFIHKNALAFDVGAHVGDRTKVFRQLGANVIAVEPQPSLSALIERRHRSDPCVTVVKAAVGASPGLARMHLNAANPTVATLSRDMINRARDADGWREQTWSGSVDVPVTTLDALISEHGVPAFIKIDVEGLEDAVLEGLSTPVPALSFEFTGLMNDVAQRALTRTRSIGDYEYNVAIGESQRLVWTDWRSADDLHAFLVSEGARLNSGDVYARLLTGP